MRRILTLAALAALFTTASSCQALFPFSPENLTETRVRALCHFAYACCTPVEAAVYVGFLTQYKDEGACVAELLEDDLLASVHAVDQQARDAVARGAAEYDGEAAEECSRELLDAVNSCDVDALTTGGQVDFSKIFYLVDTEDEECSALAQRNFARGNVEDGDECHSSVDCEEFGSCVVETDPDVITTEGECVTPGGEGDPCNDVGCQPGLQCVYDGEPTCEDVPRLADGEGCEDNAECDSGFCDFEQSSGNCVDAGTPCLEDADCDVNAGDFCVTGFGGQCGAVPKIKVEICDGE
jgi:hypothetical protein